MLKHNLLAEELQLHGNGSAVFVASSLEESISHPAEACHVAPTRTAA